MTENPEAADTIECRPKDELEGWGVSAQKSRCRRKGRTDLEWTPRENTSLAMAQRSEIESASYSWRLEDLGNRDTAVGVRGDREVLVEVVFDLEDNEFLLISR